MALGPPSSPSPFFGQLDAVQVVSGVLYAADQEGLGSIVRMAVSGAGFAQLTTQLNSPSTTRLAVDATHVYWASWGLGRVTLDGSALSPLVASQGCPSLYGDIALDDTMVYATCPDKRDSGAVDSPMLVRLPKAGGPSTVLLAGHQVATLLAVQAGQAYLTAFDGNVFTGQDRLVEVATSGNSPPRVLATERSFGALAASPQHIYFTDAMGVWKVPTTGTPALVSVATATTGAGALTLDETCAYWLTRSAQPELWKIAR